MFSFEESRTISKTLCLVYSDVRPFRAESLFGARCFFTFVFRKWWKSKQKKNSHSNITGVGILIKNLINIWTLNRRTKPGVAGGKQLYVVEHVPLFTFAIRLTRIEKDRFGYLRNLSAYVTVLEMVPAKD